MAERVLVLNLSYQPLGTTTVARALHLLLESRADPVSEAHTVVRSASRSVKVPAVIRLRHVTPSSHHRRIVMLSRRRVLLRDGHRCAYCQERADTVDHVVPRSRPGGTNTWTNVVAACRSCNNRKANRTPEEAGMKLLVRPQEPQGTALIMLYAVFRRDAWEPWL